MAALSLLLAACTTTSQPATRAPSVAPPPAKPAARPVVAVFNVQARGVAFGDDVLARLSDYLTVILVESGSFKVVPREQIAERIRGQKRDSYKPCYERDCQIEIGRELAASKSLATQIVRLGATCKVTATLFDLRSATAESGARAEGPCDEAELAAMFMPLVARLAGKEPTDFPVADGATGDAPDERGGRGPRAITLDCTDCVFAVDEDPSGKTTDHRTDRARQRAKSHYEDYKRRHEEQHKPSPSLMPPPR